MTINQNKKYIYLILIFLFILPANKMAQKSNESKTPLQVAQLFLKAVFSGDVKGARELCHPDFLKKN